MMKKSIQISAAGLLIAAIHGLIIYLVMRFGNDSKSGFMIAGILFSFAISIFFSKTTGNKILLALALTLPTILMTAIISYYYGKFWMILLFLTTVGISSLVGLHASDNWIQSKGLKYLVLASILVFIGVCYTNSIGDRNISFSLSVALIITTFTGYLFRKNLHYSTLKKGIILLLPLFIGDLHASFANPFWYWQAQFVVSAIGIFVGLNVRENKVVSE